MKKISLLLISFALLLSCKKELKQTQQEVNYLYRLAIIDIDSSMTQTSVRVATVLSDQITSQVSNQTVAEEVVSSISDDDDCARRPNHPKCKSLPITMEYFEAYVQNNTPIVEWKTSLEDNVARFEVQRSTDGLNFKTVKIVLPKGPSIYTVQDK